MAKQGGIAWSKLLSLTRVEVNVSQLQRPGGVGNLRHELHAGALTQFRACDCCLYLAGFTIAHISNARNARLIFIAQRQVKDEVPIPHESELGETLRQRS